MSLLKVLFDSNEREVRKLQKQVLAVNALEPQMQSLSDRVLAGKTVEFKERLAKGENLDGILPEAFAVVREASRRAIGLRHFDVQLMGGIVLHQGRISEMKTGEGKTLVATLPLYLNALLGKGVHLVTVNDYLAKRDRNWMAPIFEFLGLSVGVIQHDLSNEERRNAYLCDITYGTNNEMGFDYLRDNMVLTFQDRVLRPLYFAIVDEVDSILIDEARTPLIISGLGQESTDLYHKFARLVPRLNKTEDYTVDEKAHSVPLTEEGVTKVEKMLGIENFYEHENVDLTHHLTQALRAKELYKRDVHYVIKNGEIIIVDEFTGRLMFGRRYSEGLHQAIEAKEGVKVRQEDQTLATITFQNFFLIYEKLAGMTGTAATEEDEFRKIYNMDVVVIPTHREMIRKDHPDVVYRSEKGKFDAVIIEIGECYEQGRPVLVGTRSIEKSEMLSGMLKRKGIPHQVLNAKYHEKEAEIIAQAGKSGTITIATNMAGRGVDILLGGNPLGRVDGILQQRGIDPQEATPEERADALKLAESICEEDKRKVVSLGGLHIVGSERHESRRIDNQLRGRSGRQGDPGASRFYVSLEDELMRLFGSDRIAPIMERLGMDDETPIEHGLISRAIENAQKKVEAHNFDIRKSVLEYDNVMNTQRGVIYGERDKVLAGEDLKPQILAMLDHSVDHILSLHASDNVPPDEWDIRGLWEVTRELFPVPFDARMEDLSSPKVSELRKLLLQWATKAYEEREEKLGSLTMRELERMVLLHMIDTKWIDHLSAMDALKDGIGLRAYGQKDPRMEYIAEGHAMFEEMKRSIEEDTVKYLYRVQVVEQRGSRYRVTHTNRDEDGDGPPRVATVRKGQKVGRNDACPCGSGKKYKKCCGVA